MMTYEELRQVDKNHGEMMDEFLKSSKEARTLLDEGTNHSPKTQATTISQVKGKITSFQRYRVVLQNKAALIKRLWWRLIACTAERDVVSLIQDFDLLGADCERLEKEAADEAAIGVAKAAAQNASVPSVIPAMGMPKAMMVDVSKYVPVPFTGTGEPQTLLQEFRNWKEKWSLAKRKLKDSPHVMDEVLHTQLLNALSGEARDMVSALPAGSYDKAMEQLTAKLETVSGLQPPTFQLQEARPEPQRSRS